MAGYDEYRKVHLSDVLREKQTAGPGRRPVEQRYETRAQAPLSAPREAASRMEADSTGPTILAFMVGFLTVLAVAYEFFADSPGALLLLAILTGYVTARTYRYLIFVAAAGMLAAAAVGG
ncbi:MAG: hypothetical protein ACNS61_00445 [Candidatus Wenzhouxiangella sp. M2_3B_020]